MSPSVVVILSVLPRRPHLAPPLLLLLFNSWASSLRLPLLGTHTVADRDLTILEFIEESYQPVLVTGALTKGTVSELAPWSFPALATSLEAATTFCFASAGTGVTKDARKSGDDFENTNESRGNGDGETKNARTGAGSYVKNGYEVLEKDEAKRATTDSLRSREETEKKNWARGSEDETVKEREEAYDSISLRRFSLEGEGKWNDALTNITKDIGVAVTLPRFLRDVDFTLLDLPKTGLRHFRSGWTGGEWRGSGEGEGVLSAGVVCVVGGRLSLTLTPFTLPWNHMQCSEETWQCELLTGQEEESDERENGDSRSAHEGDSTHTHAFLSRALVQPRFCLYIPQAWRWSGEALEDTTALWLAWRGDLAFTEHLVEALQELLTDGDQEDVYLRTVEDAAESRRKRQTIRLWDVLPKNGWRPRVLWGDKNPLLHLLRRYLLSDRRIALERFLKEFRVDRTLLPDLVDCPRECQSSAAAIFSLLDADADGYLTAADATLLTPDAFTSLTQELDDLVDELKELGSEQWMEMVESGPSSSRTAFLERAKDRMAQSAQLSVRRWVEGDLEGADEKELIEKLPDLYEQVLEARQRRDEERSEHEGKAEL